MHGNTQQPYEVDNVIRLQLPVGTVRAKIVKTFIPFTQAQAMVVRIFEPVINLRATSF